MIIIKVFIVNGKGSSGKALCNSEIIPIPYGEKRVDEIKVGDYIFDRKGNPTKVLGVYPQGKRDVYEITFGDGRKIKCSKDHLWNIHKSSWHRNKSKNLFKTYTTQQILEEGIKVSDRNGYRFSIQCSEPIEYPEINYDIHPYIIGAFLGDGCCLERILTLSSNDIEIVEKINSLLGGYGYHKNSKSNYSWSFLCKKGEKNCHNILKKYYQTKTLFKDFIDEICQYSYNKRIPNKYKYGSIKQRLSLIQGLMDTDGSITKDGTVRFTSTSINLIKDLKYILGSLGYVSIISEDKRDIYTNGICYNLSIKIPNEEKYKLFSLKRKRDIALKLKKSVFRHDTVKITKIEKLNYQEDMTCFYVDNEEHLFLATDFLVTHNTTVENMIVEIAQAHGQKIEILSTIDYVKDVARGFGWDGSKEPKDRKMLSDLKDLLTEWNDLPHKIVCNKIAKLMLTDVAAVFVDCREPAEIKRFVEEYNALSVLVKRSSISMVYGNHADDNVDDYEYDCVIDNSRGLVELLDEANIFYECFIRGED